MRVVFIGTGEIGRPTLRALHGWPAHQLLAVVTQPDKPAGRHYKLQSPPIKQALTGTDVPILQPARIKNAEAVAQIRELEPEVIVVMAYGQILPKAVLEIPAVACLNLHASLLPRWRGAAPIQAAINAGDAETGITVIYMAEGLDTGDILLERKTAIAPNETGDSLHNRLAEIAPGALGEALDLLAAGQAPRIPQDNAQATHAPKLDREAGRIKWSEPAEVIERKIRAFNPWPGAFTTIVSSSVKPRHLKIYAAQVVDQSGSPGQLVGGGHGLVIAAGDRALSLQQVQVEGKQRMSGADFLRGQRGPISIGGA